ncbi:MAG: putative Ig domain-containing protein [Candidatus Limnocylindrales bacterium]
MHDDFQDRRRPGQQFDQQLSLTIADPPLTITSSVPLPPASLTVPYSTQLTASGARGNYVWSLASGSMPLGMSMTATGLISGTPTKATSYSFTLRVTSGVLTTTKALSIAVTAPVKITNTTLPDGTNGVAYSAALAATGGTRSYRWDINSSTLPPGLHVSGTKILGTPTSTGTWSVAASVTDNAGRSYAVNLPLSIYSKPVITTTSIPTISNGVFYSFTFSAIEGKAPYKRSRSSGTLARGPTHAPTGVLSGTTTYVGTNTVIVKVVDAGNRYSTQSFTYTVD